MALTASSFNLISFAHHHLATFLLAFLEDRPPSYDPGGLLESLSNHGQLCFTQFLQDLNSTRVLIPLGSYLSLSLHRNNGTKTIKTSSVPSTIFELSLRTMQLPSAEHPYSRDVRWVDKVDAVISGSPPLAISTVIRQIANHHSVWPFSIVVLKDFFSSFLQAFVRHLWEEEEGGGASLRKSLPQTSGVVAWKWVWPEGDQGSFNYGTRVWTGKTGLPQKDGP